jgi:hypothetical protein
MPRVGFELMTPVFERGEEGSCLRPPGRCDLFFFKYSFIEKRGHLIFGSLGINIKIFIKSSNC